MKNVISVLSLLLLSASSALASVSITSPANGSDVTSPFTLDANASSCSSQPVNAIAYSLDSGSDLTTVNDTTLQTEVSVGAGEHTIHVKARGNKGAVCVTDVAVKVTSTSASPDLATPSNSASVSNIQTFGNWRAMHDAGTPGSSSGSMAMVGSPSRGGATRRFITHYSHSGGERYYLTFGDDPSATNFLYDTWLYIGGSSSTLANLELDMNQVMPNGWTVIYGFQCDGYSGTWDYTGNGGSATHPKDHWYHCSAPCNPRSWAPNTWHHIQISYSRTGSGVVTYKSLTFDGKTYGINRTILSAFALGWGKVLMANFQVDGFGSGGTNTIYMDSFTVQRW